MSAGYAPGPAGRRARSARRRISTAPWTPRRLIIDLDPQVSACDWKDIRGEKPPLVAATPVPHLERTLKAAADNGADLAIIDTAGRTNDAAAAAARAADLILIPLQPSLIDLKTLGATLDIIRLAGAKPT